MRADIIEGATLPDYELPDHTDTLRKLSFLQGDDPMILTFNRGVFCPKDRQQLLQLADFSKQRAVGFARVVTVTTDNLMMSNDLRLGVGADWTFLRDEQRDVQQDLDIAEFTSALHYPPTIPHTFVLEPGLKIYKIYNGYWYWGRPSTAELHADLREVTQRCRPDWKIDTAEMREKWEQGDKKDFSPYGKTWRQVFVRMSNAVDQFE